MAGSEENMKKGIDILSMNEQGEDTVDLAQAIANLPPDTQESLGVLLRNISKGVALIDTDSEGRAQIEYKAAKKIYWDGSKANVIAAPKSDQEIQVKVDVFLELIDYMKSKKPPSGVVLDKTHISLSSTNEYREGHEFEKTKKILGTGISGDIMVFIDKKSCKNHAHKTVMITAFRKEEIKCWVDMSDSGYFPSLYLFKLENNKVVIHMEILKDAKPLRSVIDEHMAGLYQNKMTRSLVKPFSLYVLDGALEAVTQMHSRGWTHNDLHGGNVMVQKTARDKLSVKILDFGNAKNLEDQNGLNYQRFIGDIRQVIRLFSALYTGVEFNDVWDLQHNWKETLKEAADNMQMSIEDRKELFCLVDAAMKVVHPYDVVEYRNQVKGSLQKAMGDVQSETNIMKKAVAFLFPEDLKPVHQHTEVDCVDGLPENFDVADSISYHDITDHHEDRFDLDLEETADRVSDEYLEEIRLTLGINLH